MNEKILITGGSGMVGRAIQKIYKDLEFIDCNKNKFYFMSSVDADLRDFCETYDFFQNYKPDDYVLATNKQYSVRLFIEKAFALKGFNIKWKGKGVNEIGYDDKTGRELIFISDKYFRPAEVETLLGDATKAKTELNWEPKYNFDKLVKEMVEMDCK